MLFFHASNVLCLEYPQALIEPCLQLRTVWPQRHSWGVCERLWYFFPPQSKPFLWYFC